MLSHFTLTNYIRENYIDIPILQRGKQRLGVWFCLEMIKYTNSLKVPNTQCQSTLSVESFRNIICLTLADSLQSLCFLLDEKGT